MHADAVMRWACSTMILALGCDTAQETALSLTAKEVAAAVAEIRSTVLALPEESTMAGMRALNSSDPKIRAEAAISIGKSMTVSRETMLRLESIARHDPDPVARGAALSALFDLGHPSAGIVELTRQLRDDPQLGILAAELDRSR